MSRRRRSGGGCFSLLLNILTVILLVGIGCVTLTFITIFNNPQANPIVAFRPIVIPTVPPTLTPTITPQQLPPTFTPEPSPLPSATPTLRPSSTPLPTETPFSLVTPPTQNPNATPTSAFPYVVQEGNPRYADYSVINPTLGCNWMGVGGQVFENGVPKQGLVIELGGSLEGFTINALAVTGIAQNYGLAGYELPISDGPIASNKTLYIQLLDQSGAPLSDKIYFDTFDTCDKNLILINLLRQ